VNRICIQASTKSPATHAIIINHHKFATFFSSCKKKSLFGKSNLCRVIRNKIFEYSLFASFISFRIFILAILSTITCRSRSRIRYYSRLHQHFVRLKVKVSIVYTNSCQPSKCLRWLLPSGWPHTQLAVTKAINYLYKCL